jgi:hypothetical protein
LLEVGGFVRVKILNEFVNPILREFVILVIMILKVFMVVFEVVFLEVRFKQIYWDPGLELMIITPLQTSAGAHFTVLLVVTDINVSAGNLISR